MSGSGIAPVTRAPDPVARGYRLEHQVGYLLRLASQRHGALFQAQMSADLTPTQFSALLRLAEHGAVSQNQLGRLAAMDIATIKGVVDRLRQKGLVATAPARDDRRRMSVSLTQSGAALIDTLITHGQAITDATLAPLSQKERAIFLSLLQKLT